MPRWQCFFYDPESVASSDNREVIWKNEAGLLTWRNCPETPDRKGPMKPKIYCASVVLW